MSGSNDVEGDVASGIERRMCSDLKDSCTLALYLSIEVCVDPLTDPLQAKHDNPKLRATNSWNLVLILSILDNNTYFIGTNVAFPKNEAR